MNDFNSLWAVVQLWYCKALVFWRMPDFDETLPPVQQLDKAYQVLPLERKDALTLAQALFTAHDGLPEEVYLARGTHVPHESAPNHPEVFQRFLQLRAQAKENGRWELRKLPRFQTDRLDELDRYISRVGMTPI